MERRCRCHGLSGSCSIKTCWLALPNLELIGAYLKRKYDSSVHLPSAVNMNKLIPMMDRNEISAILSGERPAELEAAPLVGAGPAPAHFEYYERHKQAEQGAPVGRQRAADWADGRVRDEPPPELVDKLSPLSSQQYQALLRDSKLCNTSARLGAQQPELPAGRRGAAWSLGQQLKSASQHLSQLLAHANREDLIYLHKSPDFCSAEPESGLAGVSSRYCSENPAAPDYCDIFCCGRGYTGKVIQHRYTCECAWEYCCDVKCKLCTKEIKISVCN